MVNHSMPTHYRYGHRTKESVTRTTEDWFHLALDHRSNLSLELVSDGLVLRLQFPPEVTLEDIEFSKAMKTSSGAYADEISEVADRALASFVVIQAMLKKSLKVRKYADNAALKNRIPGFNVSQICTSCWTMKRR